MKYQYNKIQSHYVVQKDRKERNNWGSKVALRLRDLMVTIWIVFLMSFFCTPNTTYAAGMEEINAFPVSYRDSLLKLKQAHPNWTFLPMNIEGTDWSYAISQEMVGARSLVPTSKGEAWCREVHSPGWSYATQRAVEYCMDPRNYLNETDIFMFELLTYQNGIHSQDGVQMILQNSFMKGEIPGEDGTTYAQLFFRVGNQYKVSPYHLAARVYQEQGIKGTSPLISGVYPGYEGYYNFFNIKASGTTNEQIITSGLEYAKKVGWNSRSKAIDGGSVFVAQSYIMKGQDTLYLQKFDVDNTAHGMFVHQYMQNILAPSSESKNILKVYQSAGAGENNFVFKIPVYRNMPMNACPRPSVNQAPNLPMQEQLTKDFIIRLYKLALGRTVYAESEVQFWYDTVASGENTGADVAWGFFFSKEFVEKELSDEEYVKLLYRVMFDREADQAGYEEWLKNLKQGMRREYVYAGFANSTEFSQVCANYGIKRGTIHVNAYRDRNKNLTAFLTRLYEKVLGRGSDPDGIENWCKVILTGEKNVEEVSFGFVFSPEFLEKNIANTEFLKIMYRTFLNREPDPPGYQFWLERLEKGTARYDVFEGFVYSKEYRELRDEYGL